MERRIAAVLMIGLVVCVAGCAQTREAWRLVGELDSTDPAVKRSAGTSLVGMGAAAVPVLAQLVREQDGADRSETVSLLARIGMRHKDAEKRVIDLLIDLIGVTEGDDRMTILYGLRVIGSAAVPELVERGITGPKEEQRTAMALAWVIDEQAIVRELMRALSKHKSSAVTPRIVESLRSFTKTGFGYDREKPRKERRQAVRQWLEWWESQQHPEQ